MRARLTELHGVVPGRIREGVGTDVYIDAAGAPNIVNDVIGMAKHQARMVVTAAYMQPVEFNLGGMLTTEMSITTSMGYPDEMPEVVAALPRLSEQARGLISHRMPFDEVLAALDVAAGPQSAKVMIDFEAR